MNNSENNDAQSHIVEEDMNDVDNSVKELKLSNVSPIALSNTNNNKASKNKSKYINKCNISSTVLKELSLYGITLLKKTSLKFPNAAFFCHVCDYHCDTVSVCRKHISESRHQKSTDILEQKSTISVLPMPNSDQLEIISELIIKVSKESGMSADKKAKCEVLKQYIEEEIQKCIPDIYLLINGSCLSGFALQSSGLDLDLFINKNKTKELGHIFEEIYKIIVADKQFNNESKAFTASYPQVCFTHVASGVEVSIGLHNAASIYTNELFSHYATLDDRVIILGIAFRYWAKLCEIDRFSEGTLAARCFPLMVIYFLQRCKEPVLPCLHKERKDKNYAKPSELKPRWKSLNESSVGTLWLELFRFYSVGINFKHYLIDISSPHYLYRTTKKSIKMGIEEPLYCKTTNTSKKWLLSQSVTSNDVFYYIFATIRNTFFYFLVPQRCYGPLFCTIKNGFLNKPTDNEINNQNSDNVNNTINDGEAADESNEPEIKLTSNSSTYYDIVKWPEYTVEDEPELLSIDAFTTSLKAVDLDCALKLAREVRKNDLTFKFDVKYFTRGEKVPVRCSVCHMGGHTKNNCTEFDLPPLCSLPDKYSQAYRYALTSALEGLRDDLQPAELEMRSRNYILHGLQYFIRESYPKAILELFGSSSNGFGFSGSDLDICFMFEDNSTGKGIDEIQIIKNLAQKFKSGINKEFVIRDVLAVTTAKVPIVKFYLPRSRLEVDISLYNILAFRNTKLLSTYTRIDERCQIIGYALKYLAKQCDIGAASRGSLSSYAYILLVIHYLQQCSPPVLPVLQELHSEKEKNDSNIIDGWNTWFYNDIDNLPEVWEGYGKNKMSVAQLWIGLLRYYTETFDWDLTVVSIKQIEPLSRMEKIWNTQCIAIEDPFDLNHNLGGGLSRRMSTYIMKCFIRGREIFGDTASLWKNNKVETILVQIRKYAFASDALTDGYPPIDRGCRCCGNIGHIVKDCPKKRQLEERKKERRVREEINQLKESPVVVSSPKKMELPPGIIQVELTLSVVIKLLNMFICDECSFVVDLGYRIYTCDSLPELVPGTVYFNFDINYRLQPIYILCLSFTKQNDEEKHNYVSKIQEDCSFKSLLDSHIANISSNLTKTATGCKNTTSTRNQPPQLSKSVKNKGKQDQSKFVKNVTNKFSKTEMNWLRGTTIAKKDLYADLGKKKKKNINISFKTDHKLRKVNRDKKKMPVKVKKLEKKRSGIQNNGNLEYYQAIRSLRTQNYRLETKNDDEFSSNDISVCSSSSNETEDKILVQQKFDKFLEDFFANS